MGFMIYPLDHVISDCTALHQFSTLTLPSDSMVQLTVFILSLSK
jgi:hypothetical protein